MSDGDTAASLDGLMNEFAWAMHDFQAMAHTLSLLVSSLDADDGLDDGASFHADIDAVTNRMPASAVAKRINSAMTEADRHALRTLKRTRDDLVYRFFVTHRIDAGRTRVPEGALAAVRAARADIKAGQAVLDRLVTALSQEKTE